jgi:predicted CxxxxCH...CXXCH cytochrome family protein
MRFALATSLLLACSCVEERDTFRPPTYRDEVAAILDARCVTCHQGDAAASGWRATTYLDAIGCISNQGAEPRPATLPLDAHAPLLAVLRTPSHASIVSPNELATLEGWIESGAPAFPTDVHSPTIVDPRSPDFHGRALRAERWASMLDAESPQACGRCHEGSVSRPAGVTRAAPFATPCTSCHSAPGGVLACTTCHGAGERNGARAYPPRDACFFGPDPTARAHAVHVEGSPSRPAPMLCSTCHPPVADNVSGSSDAEVLSGTHGNGAVDVRFDTSVVDPSASYDATTGACTVSCHDRGGAHARPRWSESLTNSCGNCHGSPPADHYPGACTACHQEANADGTALSGGPLHMNGRVDLGNGSSGCGACHGQSTNDPWPNSNAHRSHETPTLTTPIDCETCHPGRTNLHDPGHLDGIVEIAFSGRAIARGSAPSYEPGAIGRGTGTCANVACHGAALADIPAVTPRWDDQSGAARACGSCHPVPPSQHTASTSCDRAECHGSEVARMGNGFQITDTGRVHHIDGLIEDDRSTPP